MTTAGQNSTFEDPTETTPTEVTQLTTGSSMTSPSQGGAGFYVACALLIITIVGAALNALVLYAMIASKQHRKRVLIFNQNVLDFVNCVFLSVDFALKLCNINLNGTLGYWLCVTLMSGAGAWGAYVGSVINLAAISIERYLKIVHRTWAENKLRKWMIYSTIAVAWIGGVVLAVAVNIPSSGVLKGMCYTRSLFQSQAAQITFGLWNFLSFYVIIFLIFIFCYGHILIVVRRQARVMAAHGGSNTAQDQSHRIQTNIIKTMIFVSGLYAITWAPLYTYTLLKNFRSKLTTNTNGLYAVLCIGYIYIWTNPFIYATKFNPVKRILQGLILYKNTHPLESVGNT